MEFNDILILLKNKIHFPYVIKYFEGKRILDVGCGNGIFAQAVKESVNCDITLLDVDDFRDENLMELDFFKASAHKLPFPDSSFDIVYAQLVLHHIDPKLGIEKVFNEFSRVSRDKIILYEEIATDKTDMGKAKEFDEQVNLEITNGRENKVYNYFRVSELNKIFAKIKLKVDFHKVLKKGSEKDGYLQKHFFVLKKT